MSCSGRIQTVLGLVDPSDVGITFPHEHLSLDFHVSYQPCEDEQKATIPFKMENLGWIRQNPYSHKPNLTLLDSENLVMQEIKEFKAKGGSCMVENSTIGLSRNMTYLKGVSEATGVHIVAGTGYYVDASRPWTHGLTVEQMTERITNDVRVGWDGSDVKCGVIGEVGCTWPLTESEKRSLQASAIAQSQLGCGVIIHPGRNESAPAEIGRILQEAGGDLHKTVMSHLDRTIQNDAELLEFAEMGMYCEYDLFGVETSHYQLWREADMPSDAERIRRIRALVEAGYGDKILIAHDIHTKHRLAGFGGHGFSHILDNVFPKMLQRGLTQADIDKMLIHNPRAWMTFK